MAERSGPKDWSPRTAFARRVQDRTEDALQEFWAKIAKSFPEAVSGDLDPMSDQRFNQRALDIVLEWLHYNLPTEGGRERALKIMRDRGR